MRKDNQFEQLMAQINQKNQERETLMQTTNSSHHASNPFEETEGPSLPSNLNMMSSLPQV
jgi:hypothetical protein